MHILPRVVFWLAASALAFALVMPAVHGAGWTETQLIVVAGIFAVFGSSLWSVIVLPRALSDDPFASAKHRRSTGIAYSLVAFLVMGVGGAVTEVKAQQELDATRSYLARVEAERTELARFGLRMVDDRMERSLAHAQIEDAADGSWSGVYGLVGAGAALIALIAFAARRVPQPPMHPAWGGWQHQHHSASPFSPRRAA